MVNAVKQRSVIDAGVFDDFRHAVAENFIRERGERVKIAQHRNWLIKAAHKVFALGNINGCFAADGGIRLRQQGGGNLHIVDAAQIRGSRKARQVTDNAAAQGNDEVGASQLLCRKKAPQRD